MGHWPTTSTASTQGAEATALSHCSPSLEDSGAQAKPCRGRGFSLYVLQLREPVLCVMNALHVLWCPPRVTPVALSAKHGFSLPTCCLSAQLHLCNQSKVEHALPRGEQRPQGTPTTSPRTMTRFGLIPGNRETDRQRGTQRAAWHEALCHQRVLTHAVLHHHEAALVAFEALALEAARRVHAVAVATQVW